MKQPNIDFLMNMTKEYLDGKIDSITYSLDFPHELDLRYKKARSEDDDYCDLIYECLSLSEEESSFVTYSCKCSISAFYPIDGTSCKQLIHSSYFEKRHPRKNQEPLH